MMPLPTVGLLFIFLPVFVEFCLCGIVHEYVLPSGCSSLCGLYCEHTISDQSWRCLISGLYTGCCLANINKKNV